NAELLALGANEAQKKQWMEPLLDGRLRSAFSMTEPNAGADPTLLTTRAVRDIPTMEHPEEGTGYAGGHSEVLYRDVRVPAENLIGAEGDGFLLAQKRLGPGRIHHCMRWLGQ